MTPTRTWPLVLVAIACSGKQPGAPRGVAVRVAEATIERQEVAPRFAAQIVPNTRLELAFTVGGYITTIAKVETEESEHLLQEGDAVTAGMELATLRLADFTAHVAEARAAVAQASAAFREAHLDATRDAKLVRSGSLPGATADTSRNRRAGAHAVLAGARARLAEARTALADASLESPMNGVIAKRHVEIGSLVAPGMVAFTIIDVSTVKAVFGIPDTTLSQLRIGAVHEVTTEALDGVKLAGRVSKIAPAADVRSRMFEVEVTIANTDGRLKAGMIATLALASHTPPAPPLPLVPLSAVVRPPSGVGFAVYVVEKRGDATFVRAREIELGAYLGQRIPVARGLAGGERVVVQGATLVHDGERVEVIP